MLPLGIGDRFSTPKVRAVRGQFRAIFVLAAFIERREIDAAIGGLQNLRVNFILLDTRFREIQASQVLDDATNIDRLARFRVELEEMCREILRTIAGDAEINSPPMIAAGAPPNRCRRMKQRPLDRANHRHPRRVVRRI